MKHDYDKILTRLFSTLARLNNGDVLSTKELAEEYNVTTKTIQRDFQKLLVNFPVYQENRKWKMQEGYKIEKSKDITELLVLNIMAKMADEVGGSFSRTAKHIFSKIKNEEFNPIYTKLSMEDISSKLPEIQLLEQAIREKKVISCLYDNEKERAKREILKPLKIMSSEGFWYLVAFDTEDYIRKLYVKNVSLVKLDTELFSVNDDIDEMLINAQNIWFQSDREPFKVRLIASAEIAKYFRRKPLPTQHNEKENEDGSLELRVSITYYMEIFSVVKYWLPHLKIVEPVWLKEKLFESLTEFIKEN